MAEQRSQICTQSLKSYSSAPYRQKYNPELTAVLNTMATGFDSGSATYELALGNYTALFLGFCLPLFKQGTHQFTQSMSEGGHRRWIPVPGIRQALQLPPPRPLVSIYNNQRLKSSIYIWVPGYQGELFFLAIKVHSTPP